MTAIDESFHWYKHSAVDANADYILTRNTKDFDFGDGAVMTAREFFEEQNIEIE